MKLTHYPSSSTWNKINHPSQSQGFIKYIAVKPNGEKIEFTNNTSDAKFFYVKLVEVEDMPIFPK